MSKATDMLIRGPVLPEGFGEGWMSAAARDLCRIAVTVAGFDPRALVTELHKRAKPGRNINVATVERALGLLHDRTREDRE